MLPFFVTMFSVYVRVETRVHILVYFICTFRVEVVIEYLDSFQTVTIKKFLKLDDFGLFFIQCNINNLVYLLNR